MVRGTTLRQGVLQARPPMLVSYRWLCELLPAASLDKDEVADALTAVGLAVDGIVDHEAALRPVVLAEVVGVEPHPSRDNLQLVTIRTKGDVPPPSFIGSMAPALPPKLPPEITVVCGAKNVPPPGHLVVFAGLGVQLPGVDFVLTKREIGGVPSEGMLCSEAELGLADSSLGILTYPPGAFLPGMRFIDAFDEARDVIYELDVTPNRPDALGHVGVARDMSAFFEVDLELPQASVSSEAGVPSADEIAVHNQAKARCPKYGAAVVRGVQIGPSPDYMRWRLHRLGTRPISNVVDVTNWLLLEFGQPLHAFDLDKVRGKQIVIRLADDAEEMSTLDGVERKLTSDDLVICDGQGPTALAGIMGGKVSEISASTKDVLLECAYFLPSGVRRSARRHGIHTESSHRFERGTDYGGTELVLDRARALLGQLAKGIVAPGVVVDNGEAVEPGAIELNGAKMDTLLGVNVPFKWAMKTLRRLGFRTEYLVDTKAGPVASVRGASYRPDVTLEQDLIEEVARIRGLDKIPTILPAIAPQEPRSSGLLERRAVRVAVELGLSEALTYAFVNATDLKALAAPPPIVRLENPLNEERNVLRTSLAPGLIEALARSRRRGEPSVRIFTVGAVFLSPQGPHPSTAARVRTAEDQGKLPYEQPSFAALLAGPRDEYLTLKPDEVDIYDAKAIAVEMVERMTGKSAQVRHVGSTEKTAHLHPRAAAMVSIDGTDVGTFGSLHPDVVDHFDLSGSALLIELNLAIVEGLGRVTPRYRPIPKLPAIVRDLSLVVSDVIAAKTVAEAIAQATGELCESVDLAAEFRGGSVPIGHRSLTFRVVYRDPKARSDPDAARTLTDKEVEAIELRALEKTRQELGATLRG